MLRYRLGECRSAILGAALGYLSLWNFFYLFPLLTGKTGMEFGDFKLLAMFETWPGWQYLPQIILFSVCAGALVGTTLGGAILLAITIWIGLMRGDAINRTYLQVGGVGVILECGGNLTPAPT